MILIAPFKTVFTVVTMLHYDHRQKVGSIDGHFSRHRFNEYCVESGLILLKVCPSVKIIPALQN